LTRDMYCSQTLMI